MSNVMESGRAPERGEGGGEGGGGMEAWTVRGQHRWVEERRRRLFSHDPLGRPAGPGHTAERRLLARNRFSPAER